MPKLDHSHSKTARAYVDRLLPWIDAHAESPFFVFLHVFDPHDPFRPYAPWETLYADDAEIDAHEEQIKKLKAYLAEKEGEDPPEDGYPYGPPPRGEDLEGAEVDAQAYVVNNPNSGSSSSSDDSLELVIIIAIVIACVAFLFLIFAIFWAWRYDKRNRRAFLAENRKSTTDETFDAGDSPESKEKPMVKTQTNNKKTPVLPSYPSVIGGESQADGGVYPESVISEDIHSSLSQYYTGGAAGNYNYSNGRLQDAASVSSMESYGYSLDGYTQSVSTPMPTKLLPTEPANTDSWMDTKDLRTDDESGNDWGVSTDYKYSLKSALDGPGVIVSGDLPTDEEEMPPPSDIEDQSMLESMMDESAIHTAVFTADDR